MMLIELKRWLFGQTSDQILKQAMVKFHRAASAAKIIGKGSVALHQQGYEPLLLQPEYFPEVTKKTITFVKKEERHLWSVDVERGKLIRNGKIYHTAEGKRCYHYPCDNFVISPDLKIYAGLLEVDHFHHSSLVNAGAVLFAGEIETDASGRVIQISNRSGHYQPQQKHLLCALELFKQWKIDLSQAKLMEYSKKENNVVNIYRNIEAYRISQGTCRPNERLKT